MPHRATVCTGLHAALLCLFVAACSTSTNWPETKSAPESAMQETTAKSGYYYQSMAEQSLQDDQFANPGYLWVDQGKTLFETNLSGPTCASCHQTQLNSMQAGQWQSAATRYPTFDTTLDRVISLEQRINQCRNRHQSLPAYSWESPELLALTAFVANNAKGERINAASLPYDLQSSRRGEAYFRQRKGQLNLACHHCHEQNPGKMLRGDRLSEGLPTGYPAYKLDWESLGSVQRRLRDCDVGVRAEPYEYGAQIYVDVTRYLNDRAAGLAIETPAVRR